VLLTFVLVLSSYYIYTGANSDLNARREKLFFVVKTP